MRRVRMGCGESFLLPIWWNKREWEKGVFAYRWMMNFSFFFFLFGRTISFSFCFLGWRGKAKVVDYVV